MRNLMATNSRDWSTDRSDAWLYGIVLGWGHGEAMAELAEQHGWAPEDVRRLKSLHEKFNEAFPQPWSTPDDD